MAINFTSNYQLDLWLSTWLRIINFYQLHFWLSTFINITSDCQLHFWLSTSLLIINLTPDYQLDLWLSIWLLIPNMTSNYKPDLLTISFYLLHYWLWTSLLTIDFNFLLSTSLLTINRDHGKFVRKKKLHFFNKPLFLTSNRQSCFSVTTRVHVLTYQHIGAVFVSLLWWDFLLSWVFPVVRV